MFCLQGVCLGRRNVVAINKTIHNSIHFIFIQFHFPGNNAGKTRRIPIANRSEFMAFDCRDAAIWKHILGNGVMVAIVPCNWHQTFFAFFSFSSPFYDSLFLPYVHTIRILKELSDNKLVYWLFIYRMIWLSKSIYFIFRSGIGAINVGILP